MNYQNFGDRERRFESAGIRFYFARNILVGVGFGEAFRFVPNDCPTL